MSNNGAKTFENNWAYLKTELRWLDRMLMMAVARKRQNDKTVQRAGNSTADQVTSHWWKGIITVNRGIDDREGPPPKRQAPTAITTVTYSQQLQTRVLACQQAGIVLALPLLCEQLQLSEVEKNILLMAIAPEINRRYGRLYDYLQEEEGALADLPTVDLCLRLLCRNDQEWQQARARLTAPHSLANLGLLEWIGDEDGTLLSQQARVSDALSNFLLADSPTAAELETLLSGASLADENATSTLSSAAVISASQQSDPVLLSPPAVPEASPSVGTEQSTMIAPIWDDLVLSKKLIRQLQYLSRQARARQSQPQLTGLMVLMCGAAGTGKTFAASAIANELGVPLACVDLQALDLEDYPRVLTDAPTETSSLLLVKHGEQWFGRKSQVEQSWLHQWWQWRQQFGLTLVTVATAEQIRPRWRQQFDVTLTLPRPQTPARQRLWDQAFAADIKTHKLDWLAIARQLPLTGGDIQTLAETIELDLRSRKRTTITLSALRDALQLHHPDLSLKDVAQTQQ
ncbi:MAG: AAA family ATPase [Leptolyngbyaceae cyanobacterium]|mgnify:CR=1 FL=1